MDTLYRQHAIKRMFERGISTADVEQALKCSTIIKDYPEDKPFPSCLCLGYAGVRPLHIVYADRPHENQRIIITVYEPDPSQWSADFTQRITTCIVPFASTEKPDPESPA